MHILVVEDDAPLARIVKKSLESGGHTVEVATDGQEGLDLGRQRSHDAVVLDIQLPKVNGMDVCRMLREDGNRVPIIMLTARGAVADRINGLDAGADDYLPKPFSLAELQARLRALSRRGQPSDNEVLESGAAHARPGRPRAAGERCRRRDDRDRAGAARAPHAERGRRPLARPAARARLGRRPRADARTSSTSTSTTCAGSSSQPGSPTTRSAPSAASATRSAGRTSPCSARHGSA